MTGQAPHGMHLQALGDAFTAVASVFAAVGWALGWLTPLVSFIVLCMGGLYYYINITDHPKWRQWMRHRRIKRIAHLRRKHRARVKHKTKSH